MDTRNVMKVPSVILQGKAGNQECESHGAPSENTNALTFTYSSLRFFAEENEIPRKTCCHSVQGESAQASRHLRQYEIRESFAWSNIHRKRGRRRSVKRRYKDAHEYKRTHNRQIHNSGQNCSLPALRLPKTRGSSASNRQNQNKISGNDQCIDDQSGHIAKRRKAPNSSTRIWKRTSPVGAVYDRLRFLNLRDCGRS